MCKPGEQKEGRGESSRKKSKSRSRVNSLGWLDMWGRKMNIPYLEYTCMPIAELSDLADLYAASEGNVIVREIEEYEGSYIPDLR